MNKGLKLILGVVLLLIVGYFVATYWIGAITEQQWRKQVADLSAQTPGLDVVITAYDRSLYGATVTTDISLELPDENGAAEPLTLTLLSHVKHGPLVLGDGPSGLMLFSAETTVKGGSGPLGELFAEVPELQRLSFTDRVSFGLDYEGVGQLPAFERTSEVEGANVHLRFDGLTCNYSGRFKGEKTARVTLTMPGLVAQGEGDDVQVELKNLTGAVDLREALAGIFSGNSEVQLESFAVSGSDQGEPFRVKLDGLKVAAIVDVLDGMLSETLRYDIRQLDVNGDLYGPGALEVILSNLDAKALSQLQQDLQQLQQEAQMTPGSEEDVAALYLQGLEQNLLPLVKTSPKLEIRTLDFNTPFGNFTSHGQLQIDGSKVMAVDPVMLMIATSANAELQVDKGLLKKAATGYALSQPAETADVSPEVREMRAVQQATQQIDGLVAAGILVDTGDSYRLQAEFGNGSFLVNGQPMQ